MRRARLRPALWVLALGVLVGCQGPTSPARLAIPVAEEPARVAPSGPPKTLIIAGGRDHQDMNNFGGGTQDAEIIDLVAVGLFRQNALTFNADPWLTTEAPSPDKGTWVVHPDGTMTTTYRLHPTARWHDGAPVTSRDFILGWQLARDPKWGHFNPQAAQLITGIEAPNDNALLLHWGATYGSADRIFRNSLEPLPGHILERPAAEGDVEAFRNHPYWSTAAFVGNGPFKITRWDPGQEMELVAFDAYFLGRPKIDRIVWRFIYDLNSILANVLANNIDVALRQAFTIDTGLVARDQWEATGQGTVYFTPVTMERVNLSVVNPWLADVRARRAMLHAIDRQAITETVSHGIEAVTHIPLAPAQPEYARGLAVSPSYPYDPARARLLLGELGWMPGGDGVLVNGRGERFVIDGQTLRGQVAEQLQAVTVDFWKRIGIETQINNLTAREMSAPEYRGQHLGGHWAQQSLSIDLWSRFYGTAAIPRAETRWVGGNIARWDDPAKERLLGELGQTLDRQREATLIVDFVKLYMEQLPHLPLKYQAEVMSVRKGIVNLHPRPLSGAHNTRTWNAEQWDRW